MNQDTFSRMFGSDVLDLTVIQTEADITGDVLEVFNDDLNELTLFGIASYLFEIGYSFGAYKESLTLEQIKIVKRLFKLIQRNVALNH